MKNVLSIVKNQNNPVDFSYVHAPFAQHDNEYIEPLNFLVNCHAFDHWYGEHAKIVYIDESRVSALPIVQTEAGEFIDMNTSELKIGALLMGDEIWFIRLSIDDGLFLFFELGQFISLSCAVKGQSDVSYSKAGIMAL